MGEEVEWDSVTIAHRLRASFGILTRALELVQHIHVWCLRGLDLGLVDTVLFLRLHWIVLHIVLCCRDLCNFFTAGEYVHDHHHELGLLLLLSMMTAVAAVPIKEVRAHV